MTKLATNELSFSSATIFESGIREGLELAARIAERHAALQQQYSDECMEAMPNSAHAFALQKLVASQIAERIRDAGDARTHRQLPD
jgi:hypothetical protein